MQETTNGKQTKADCHGGSAIAADCRRGKGTNNDDVPYVASGKKILFPFHRQPHPEWVRSCQTC
jgi:hypothetical protein